MNKRNTIQKTMVLNAVCELGCHATADEIYLKISAENPQVSKATVYRNLNILSDDGEIRKIEIPNGPDCYDHITDKHYHVKCIQCGRVFDVAMEPLSEPIDKIKDAQGFDFIDYDIIFKGICPDCKNELQGGK